MMTPKDRYWAAMTGQPVDKTPTFSWFPQLLRGEFEREMRNRGMTLVYVAAQPAKASTPGLKHRTEDDPKGVRHIYETPVGTVDEVVFLSPNRISNADMWLQAVPRCRRVEDFEPIIWMAENTKYTLDLNEYIWTIDDLGGDGVIRYGGGGDPDTGAKGLLGLENWALFQYDYPEEMDRLIDALGRRNIEACRVAASADVARPLMDTIASFDDSISPRRFRKVSQHWLKEQVDILHEAGILAGVHAHGSLLKNYAPAVCELGLDYVESYTPPPYSDLSLAEARSIWGPDVTIQINFPETIFFEGYKKTFDFTIDLLKQDESPRKLIGFSEMGMTGVMENTRPLFETGFRAIMDAIDEFYK